NESAVECRTAIRREDGEARVVLHSLKEVVDLDIRVAVVAVAHLGATAEESIGLVEEEDRAASFSGVKNAPEVLLGLADVLADDAGEIDAIEIEVEVGRDDLRGHRLSGAARAREQRGDAPTTAELRAEAPRLVHASAIRDLARELAQLPADVIAHDDVVPAVARSDPHGERIKRRADLLAARAPDVLGCDRSLAATA